MEDQPTLLICRITICTHGKTCHLEDPRTSLHLSTAIKRTVRYYRAWQFLNVSIIIYALKRGMFINREQLKLYQKQQTLPEDPDLPCILFQGGFMTCQNVPSVRDSLLCG